MARRNGSKKKDVPHTKFKIEGFSRVQIMNQDGTLAGDSGWCGPNQVTNIGVRAFLCDRIGSSNTASYVSYVALGTGTVPGAAALTLDGEISGSTKRTSVTYAQSSSHTARFTATFSSANSFLSGASNIRNVGLFYSTNTSDTLFAGNTYTSSSCDTNQNVNVTYEIRFATA